jgi:FSR family fosmidomycin resistance protein-like MFS transporter
MAQPAVRTGIAGLAMLSAAHFMVDLYAAALAALQPLIVKELGLTIAQAGLAGGMLLISSSLLQPVYGYLSDRFHTRMFTVLAPGVAGVFLSALGSAPTFAWVLVLAVMGGAGVASFHPQASSWATSGVAEGRGRWMAMFISAGTLGMALGPAYFSLISGTWGLGNTYWAAIPGVAASALLWIWLPEAPMVARRKPGADWNAVLRVWKPLSILYFAVFVRSVVQIAYTQFLPLYLFRERGLGFTQSNLVLSAYIGAGALGGMAGGWLTDRIGGKRVILISMIGSVPLLAVFFLTTGWVSMAGLLTGGLILLFTIPVNVVMAQELAPEQSGTVSALMMGFAWGAAGVLVMPIAGWASDYFSMHSVLFSLLVFPIAGFFVTRLLPE